MCGLDILWIIMRGLSFGGAMQGETSVWCICGVCIVLYLLFECSNLVRLLATQISKVNNDRT